MKHFFIVINALSLMGGIAAMVRLIQLFTLTRKKIYSAQILFFSVYSYLMTAAIIFSYIFINISSSEFLQLLFAFLIYFGMAAMETFLPLYLFRLKKITNSPVPFFCFGICSGITIILGIMLIILPSQYNNLIMAAAFSLFGLSLAGALILFFKSKAEQNIKGLSPLFYILFAVILAGAILEIYIINTRNIAFYTSLSLPAAYILTSIIMLRTPNENRKPLLSIENSDAQHYNLTSREKQIAELLLQGMSNKEIAFRLKVSESTVKNHIYNLFQKLGIQKRTDLFSLFMK